MKNIFKILSLVLCIAIAVSLFASCGNNSSDSGEKTYKVSVLQLGKHPSLDNCYEGIKQALEASDIYENIVIDFQEGNFDSSACDIIAKNMAAKNCDMIIAIATPAAVSAYSAAVSADIPVVFCAVSDPVKSGLVDSVTAPGSECSGTSDIPDFNAQLELITTMQPQTKKIGVLYTTSEVNSISQLAELKKLAADFNVEIVEQGVQSAAEIPQAATTLLSKVDCITNLTDNNIVNNISTVIEKANALNIPVYGSEVEQLKKGCIAAVSIDYIALGKTTGEMAIKALKGDSLSKMPVVKISDGSPVANPDALELFGITLPEKYSGIDLVPTEK